MQLLPSLLLRCIEVWLGKDIEASPLPTVELEWQQKLIISHELGAMCLPDPEQMIDYTGQCQAM